MNNPIPTEQVEQAKVLLRLVTNTEFPSDQAEARAAASELEDALTALLMVNEWDPLDDVPSDTVIALVDVGSAPGSDAPVVHPSELSAADRAWLKQLGIAVRKKTAGPGQTVTSKFSTYPRPARPRLSSLGASGIP
jgi:hypothetical protein